MANTPTQKGTSYVLGFGSLAYTGFLPEDGVEEAKPVGNTVTITDGDGATVNVTTFDERHTLKASFKIATGGSVIPVAESANVTLTPPGGTSTVWRNASAPVVKTSREFTIVTLDLIKENSMTYT